AASTTYNFSVSVVNTADRSRYSGAGATYSTPAAPPVAPTAPTIANATGNVYAYNEYSGTITGRAWDPNFPDDLTSVSVDINVDGLYYNIPANKVRPATNGTGIDGHYFAWTIPTALRTDKQAHT